MYKRPSFINKLQYKYNRKKIVQDNYEDIYDGKIYKELSQPNKILSDPNNISFMWNTDGIRVFKSSTFNV